MKFIVWLIFLCAVGPSVALAERDGAAQTSSLFRDVSDAIASSRHTQLASLQIDHLISQGFRLTASGIYRPEDDSDDPFWVPVDGLSEASGRIFLVTHLWRDVPLDDPRIAHNPRNDYQEAVSLFIEVRYDDDGGSYQFTAVAVTSRSRIKTSEEGTSSSAG